ncbi:hypothetical protein ACFLW2_00850 [Chloroflexota bacterium]
MMLYINNVVLAQGQSGFSPDYSLEQLYRPVYRVPELVKEVEENKIRKLLVSREIKEEVLSEEEALLKNEPSQKQ